MSAQTQSRENGPARPCGGVDEPQLRERANELLDAGYLLLMLDSFKPRNQNDCCAGVIRSPPVWRDWLDAPAHLHTPPAVDKQHAARRTLELLQRQR